MTKLESILKTETLHTEVHIVKTIFCLSACLFFPSSVDVRVGLQRKLSAKELMLLNCGVGEDS